MQIVFANCFPIGMLLVVAVGVTRCGGSTSTPGADQGAVGVPEASAPATSPDTGAPADEPVDAPRSECDGCAPPPVCGTAEVDDPCRCRCTAPGVVARVDEGVIFRCSESGCVHPDLTTCRLNDPNGGGLAIEGCPCTVFGDHCCEDGAGDGYLCHDGLWGKFYDWPCGGFFGDAAPPLDAIAGTVVCER